MIAKRVKFTKSGYVYKKLIVFRIKGLCLQTNELYLPFVYKNKGYISRKKKCGCVYKKKLPYKRLWEEESN